MPAVTADSVVVEIEARFSQYERDFDRIIQRTAKGMAELQRLTSKPVTVKAGASGSPDREAQATERATERKVRAKRREVETEEQAAVRIKAMVDRSIADRERDAQSAERAAERVARAGSKALAAQQTKLMSGTSLSGVSPTPATGDASVNYLLRDQIDLRTRLGAAIEANDGKAARALQDQLAYLRLVQQYKRAGLSDDEAAIRAEQGLAAVVKARSEEEQRAARQGAGATGRVANGYRNLGRQISDVGVSVAGGMSPFLIIAQQAPQVADALVDTGGKAAKVAAFFAGPWGAALLAAGSVLAILAGEALKSGESVEDLVDKMRKDADQTAKTEQAKQIYARTLEGVSDAIREQEAALKQLSDADKTAAERALATAEANVKTALAVRQRAAAEAEYAAMLAQNARSQNIFAGGPGAAQSTVAAQYATEAERAATRAREAAEAYEREQRLASQAQYEVDAERAQRAADTGAVITKSYDDQIAKIKEEDRARIAAGRRARADSAARITALEKEKRAAVEAAQAKENAAKQEQRNASRSNYLVLQNPVQGGRVSSGLGARNAPTAGASRNHRGIDIAAPAGTPVSAGASGVVISAGRLGGLGNAVVVDYGGGTIAKYGHLSQIIAQRGQRVSAGEVIGKVGSTGVSTGNHLHYEVSTNGKTVDPRGRVRVGNQDASTARDFAQEQRDAERAAEEARRNADRYADSLSRLDDQILDAKGRQIVGIEAQAQAEIDAIDRAQEARTLDNQRAQRDGEIDGIQFEELELRSANLAAAQRANVNLEKQDRLRRQEDDKAGALLDTRSAQLRNEQAISDSASRRAQIDQELIDLRYDELERQQQRVIDDEAIGKASKAEADLARERLKSLGFERAGEKQAATQQNMGVYEKYRTDLDRADTLNNDLDQLKVDTLEGITDELTNATTAALGLKGAFGQIVGELIRIGIQRKLVGPLADMLFGKADGSTSGGLGSILGSIGTLFGGGRASGGAVTAGVLYRVNEAGTEGFRPSQSGEIIPLGRMRQANSATTVIKPQINVDARGAVMNDKFAEMILKQAAATSRAYSAEAGKQAYNNSPKRLQQQQILGT